MRQIPDCLLPSVATGRTIVVGLWALFLFAGCEPPSLNERMRDVEKLTDQTVLEKVAVEDKDSNVRRVAVDRLTDQPLLAKVAVEDKDSNVRRAAVERLTDQTLLVKVAVKDKASVVRRAAVERLTDQTVLEKVAIEDKAWNVRYAAAGRLTDQPLLAKVAVEDKDSNVRRAAVEKLTDQTVLEKVAVEDKDRVVRYAAVEKLTKQAVLEKVAIEDKDSVVRYAAASRLDALAINEPAEGRGIVELLNEKKIEIEAKGEGIRSVQVRMRRLVPYPFTVLVPVGSYFISARQSAQSMVTTAETKIRLITDDWRSVSVSAACANRSRDIPESKDSFTVQRSPHQAELARLMPVLAEARVPFAVRQAAVWIVTDNTGYSDLGRLRSHSGPFGGRLIGQYESAKAMKICDEAGIDIRRKAIWRDRKAIFSGLEDEELRRWLEGNEAQN